MSEHRPDEYPTPEQIEEMFLAYKRDGKNGIREVLRKRVQERQDASEQTALGQAEE